jgi:hypothetical protein
MSEPTENAEVPATLDELEQIAEVITRGEDKYDVPQEMLIEEEVPPLNKSLYFKISNMKIGEKLKLALMGNREARSLLIRDSNKLIARFVLRNPRLTDDEIVGVARNRNIDSDILRLIGEHKNWPRNYQVRLGLVTNPKTPLATALTLVKLLHERDMRLLAKSKNVSVTVAVQARRILAQRGRI